MDALSTASECHSWNKMAALEARIQDVRHHTIAFTTATERSEMNDL